MSPASHPDGLARVCSDLTMGLFVNWTPLVRFLSNCFVRVCALVFRCVELRIPYLCARGLLSQKLYRLDYRLDQEIAIPVH